MRKTVVILAALVLIAFCEASVDYAQDNIPNVHGSDLKLVQQLSGHVPPWANVLSDAGRVPADEVLSDLTVVVARPPAQEAAFQRFLQDQQNRDSLEYHHWLTPEEVGERFGRSPENIQELTDWLEAQGLTVTWISPSQTFVRFAGKASAIGNAFQTELHYYSVNGVRHFSISSDPKIPSSLAATIKAIRGLSSIDERPAQKFVHINSAKPEDTQGSTHNVSPADFATIYDVPSNLTGAGITVGIVGESRTDFADYDSYRQLTGVAFANPTEIVPTALGGIDPGPALTSPPSGDVSTQLQGEATLDVQRVGGTAQSARILLVITTVSSGGIGLAAQYLVDTTPVPVQVMSISFISCEAGGDSVVSFWDSLFQQAAAEGISAFVASGDGGASDCQIVGAPAQPPPAISPNGICSSAYVTCVGGTEFNDSADPSLYWKATNGAGLSSALSYIPEGAWNEPLDSSGDSQVAASGGGTSAFVPTPPWQRGPGVPVARAGRYTPDISFLASVHDGYVGCMAANFGCGYWFGTSAAAPSMAGIAALLDQTMGEPQGNFNAAFYSIAATVPASFHDVTVASSGVTNCEVSTPSMCNNSIPGPTGLAGGEAGYLVTDGYDEVTGLGSLDVGTFFNNYVNVSPTLNAFTVSPSTVASGGPAALTIQLSKAAPVGGASVSVTSNNPSAFPVSSTYPVPAGQTSATFTAQAGTVASSTSVILTASYTGSSQQYPIVVSPATHTPTVSVTLSTPSLTPAETLIVTVAVAGGTGNPIPTGTVSLLCEGTYTSCTYTYTLSEGGATITIPGSYLTAGQNTIFVTYSPDAASSSIYVTTNSSASVFVGPKATPTVTVSPSSSSITTAQALPVTVAVSGGSGNPTATGSVTLTGGGYTSSAATLSGGSATINIPAGSLKTGSDTFTATFTPDANSSSTYSAATGISPAVAVTLPKTTPTVSVTPSTSSITTTQSLTVTVAVVGGSGNPTATGSVTLTSGAYASAATNLSSGSATINIPAGSLAAGNDTLIVSYTPDTASSPTYNGASGTTNVAVSKVAPTLTVTPASSSITTAQGLSVTVSASGNPAPTGTVILTSVSYNSAATTLTNGSATINVPAGSLATGSDTLTASYTPDSSSSSTYNGASGSVTVVVTNPAKSTPTVTVVPSSNTITTTQPLTVMVAVSNGNATPTGTVTLTSGGYTSPAVTLSSGSATINIPSGSLAAGTDTLTVSYTPDSSSSSTYNSASGTSSLTVSKVTPTVTVTPSASSVTTAQGLSVTISISGNPTPTGSVTLTSGSYNSAATTLSSGSVTINVPAGSLALGSDTLTANYTPDSNSSSTYNKGTGTSSAVTVTTPAKTAPTVSVSPSSSSITTAQPLIVTVAVNGGTGNPAPTGSVMLTSGSYTSPAAVLNNGSATINVAAGLLSTGSDTLMVTYTPDSASSSTYNTASGTTSVAVTPAKTTPTVTVTPSASSITTAQALTVTVSVSGSPTPTGSVTVTSGSYTSGATALISGSATINVPAGSLSTGGDTLSASFTPDSNSAGTFNSASGTSSVSVNPTPSFTLAPAAPTMTVVQGSSNTDTIMVSGANGFSGDVTLSANGLPSGVTASFGTNPATGSSVLTLTAASTATVGGPVTVTITGTSGALTASTAVALTVNPAPTFVVGGGSSTLSILPGATTGNTVTITVTPSNGFTGAVNLTCSITPVTASDTPTCTLTPTSVTITGTGAQSSTLTIFTTASASAEYQLKELLWPSAGTSLALLFLIWIPRRRRICLTMLGVFALVITFGAIGCGGGGGSSITGGGGGGGGNAGTTPGSYTVTVTGTSGGITGTVATVALTVQ